MSGAPNPAFDRAAEEALRAFPVAPAELRFIRLGENITYRAMARDSGESYVLRLHRPTYHTLPELQSERTWTRALRDGGIAAPASILSRSGEDYVAVEVDGEKRWAGLTNWVDGELLSAALESQSTPDAQAAHFAMLGALFGALHNHAAAWRPPKGFIRHSLDADGLMGKHPFWGPFWESSILSAAERALVSATRDKIYQALLRYGKRGDTYSMIHADLHPQNAVVKSDGELAMIDFDDAAFGWHVYDLAVALRPYDTHENFSLYKQALLEGYRTRREIADAELAVLPMLILARRLAEIGWFYERPELGVTDRLTQSKAITCEAAAAFEPPC